ncbi:hypothetical protein V1477_014617 [Vespula maculifrons]|uniref:Uncharacterized protein n=1 Tax=Vespula maculifrons TaxID=7453 RepID=A0ABD2BHZ0_VESMC
MTKCSKYNEAYIIIQLKKKKELNFDKYKSQDKLLLKKRKDRSICYTGNRNCLFMIGKFLYNQVIDLTFHTKSFYIR